MKHCRCVEDFSSCTFWLMILILFCKIAHAIPFIPFGIDWLLMQYPWYLVLLNCPNLWGPSGPRIHFYLLYQQIYFQSIFLICYIKLRTY